VLLRSAFRGGQGNNEDTPRGGSPGRRVFSSLQRSIDWRSNVVSELMNSSLPMAKAEPRLRRQICLPALSSLWHISVFEASSQQWGHGPGAVVKRAVGKETSETNAYALSTNAMQTRSRLGWVSASTGVTYCGICLRAPISPEVGTTCIVCGARVTRTLELTRNKS
jgi:hypothetical protein